MKKNGEFVGIDEKFIPEEDKYVDESLLGSKEESKRKVKNVAVGYMIFVIICMMVPLILGISMISIGRSSNKEIEISSYNWAFENRKGLQSDFLTEYLLDEVISNNQSDRKITVIYNEISTSEIRDIIQLKNSLDKEEYLITLGYDKEGYVNKVIIEDV